MNLTNKTTNDTTEQLEGVRDGGVVLDVFYKFQAGSERTEQSPPASR